MEFVLLNTYENYIEAHIAKGALEEQDITCWLKDENTISINPVLTNALGGIKLMVARPDAEKAAAIINRIRREQKALVACPKCGSHNVELVSTPRKSANWLSALVTFFLSERAIALNKVNHCFDCGRNSPRRTKRIKKRRRNRFIRFPS